VPLLETINSRGLDFIIRVLVIRFVRPLVLSNFIVGMYRASFVKRSTITRIESYIVPPQTIGSKSVIKSIKKCRYMPFGYSSS
jgi:hypothetical protein